MYVGEGKETDALNDFWKKVKKAGVKIESEASDLSAAYISSVKTNAPDAVYVFDHFHVVKLINETLDNVRRRIVNQERSKERKEEEARRKALTKDGGRTPKQTKATDPETPRRSSVVKGTKFIQLRNRNNLTKQDDIDRLNAALELNHDLSVAYYLKEDIRLVWDCDTKQQAEAQLHDWLTAARTSAIPELVKLANSIDAHANGILTFFDKPISTGSVEGINNKSKTLKRMAYGFRDDRYFTLRLLALHDFKIA